MSPFVCYIKSVKKLMANWSSWKKLLAQELIHGKRKCVVCGGDNGYSSYTTQMLICDNCR